MNSLLVPTAPTASEIGSTAAPAVPPTTLPAITAVVPDWFAWACPCCHATLRTIGTATRGTCPACGSYIEAPNPPAAIDVPAATPAVLSVPARCASWLRRRWRALTIIGLALATLAGGIVLGRARPWVRLLGRTEAGISTGPPPPEILREKLQGFLQAQGWSAKRGFVLNPAQLDPAGTAYYQGRDPEEITASAFEPWTMPTLDRVQGVAVLRAERPARRPVLAVFRQVDREWRLDWGIFSQTYDEALPSFLAAPSYPLRTFRTRLNRVFPAALPDGTYAVELADLLDAGQKITIHLPSGTPITQKIAGGLTGTAPREATVEVGWARPDPEGEWKPMLQRLVCWGWHGLTDMPETTAPAAPSTEHFTTPSTAPLSSPPPPAENGVNPTDTIASQ